MDFLERLLLLFILSFLGGCSLAVSEVSSVPVEDPPPDNPFYHTVTYEGETVGLISSWYTGNFSNWKLIKDFNHGMDPNRIMLGDVIAIPKTMMIRNDVMPSRVVFGVEQREPATGLEETQVVTGEALAENQIDQPVVEEDIQPVVEENKQPPGSLSSKVVNSEESPEEVRIKTREELFKEMFE